MEWIWLLMFAILLFIEAATLNLITIWFAIGSLGAFFATYFTNSGLMQWLVFVIVTVIALILTRPLVRKLKGNGHVKTNLDLVVGAVGIVVADIKVDKIGCVTVLGKDWSAKSDKPIKAGHRVEILAIEGVKLIVREKEEE